MARINLLGFHALSDFEKEERRGCFAKAIAIVMKHVQENPEDWSAINRMGDLYLRLNDPKAANEQYVKVAQSHAADGAYLKAIGVWKKILRNDPTWLEGNAALADLYARQGLVAEAKQTLHVVADEYIKRDMKRETGQALRRLAKLDPSDVKVRIRLAEFYAWEGDPERAAREYARALELQRARLD